VSVALQEGPTTAAWRNVASLLSTLQPIQTRSYLFTVLHWSVATPVDLTKWPALAAYFARLRERPTIAKALKEERVLYAEELARHKAA
jgi:glutathione S-transferase